jgi:uncharacterized protein (TIGR02421 family)
MAKRETISSALISTICWRLRQNKRVRRNLPKKGRLHIDRQLPFLCVYRRPANRKDVGTERLVKGEASYLVVSDCPSLRRGTSQLIRELTATLSAEFGAFLLLELWAGDDHGKASDAAEPSVLPAFAIRAPLDGHLVSTTEALQRRLRRIKVLKQGVEARVQWGEVTHPPGMKPLLARRESRELGCSTLGLIVPPVYRSPDPQEEFPLLLRSFRRGLGLALRQAFFEFARSRTIHRPPHYHSLGRKAVVKAVWEVDRQLAEVSNSFDYLLQLTPVNSNSAFRQFRRDHYETPPEFHYRPLPIDPGLLKRQLYRVPVERVEDPALQRLFQEKQEELDLKINMLRDRDTPRFLYQSLQLFGPVDDQQLRLAEQLLARFPSESAARRGPFLDATAFCSRAAEELAFYRQENADFSGQVEIREDISGLIVSRGRLLVNADLKMSASRVDALLAHEVGTHLLTYSNGRQQPFKQLYSGLAAYEELQEGLAVLAEYLVDGLTRSRMRQLAARVIAVRRMTEGASFVETFRLLDQQHGFSQKQAYLTTMRVYRGGGFTKDAVYLRGLSGILKYVRRGGQLEPLLLGKIAVDHIPIVKELQYRRVLRPVPVWPRYLQRADVQQRFEAIQRQGLDALDLIVDSV